MSARTRREDAESLELAVTLVERVLLPVIEGGAVRPRGIIGVVKAARMAALDPAAIAAALPDEIACRLERARLGVARALCDLDEVPPLARGEWLLAAALHDLLEVGNPALSRWFGRGRAARVCEFAGDLIDQAGAPPNLASALGRHTLFSRILTLVRRDTHVTWWTGSRSFLGRMPPRHLVAWPELRRVRTRAEQVPLTELVPEEKEPSFLRAVAKLLAASPLTDLAEIGRARPSFALTGATLALVAHPVGQRLALRALVRRWPAPEAATLLRACAAAIPLEPARAPVQALASELEAWARATVPRETERARWTAPQVTAPASDI